MCCCFSSLAVLIPFLEEQIAEARHNNTKVWGKAKAILPKLKSYMNISVVFLIRDILVPTEILSKSLQSDKILPHDLMGEVERTKATLTAMCSTEGIDLNLAKNLNSFITNVSPDYVWSPSIPGKAGENVEIILSKKGWKNSALNNFAASFATIVNKELDLRFGEMGILGKFSIFNPANYVDMDIKTLESYGIAEFTEILKYFCGSQLRESDRLLDAKNNIGTILDQFSKSKTLLHKLVQQAPNKTISMQVAWRRLSSDYGHQIADILVFIYVYFTIPLQTAVVERGFSVHRNIKTRLRNLLRVQTIDSLLRVILLAPPLNEFPMDDALEAYMSKKGDGQPPLAIAQLAKAVNDIEIGDLVDGIDCDGDDAEFGPDFVDDEGVRNMSEEDSGGDSDEEVEADYDSDDELPLKERIVGMPSVQSNMLSAMGFSL